MISPISSLAFPIALCGNVVRTRRADAPWLGRGICDLPAVGKRGIAKLQSPPTEMDRHPAPTSDRRPIRRFSSILFFTTVGFCLAATEGRGGMPTPVLSVNAYPVRSHFTICSCWSRDNERPEPFRCSAQSVVLADKERHKKENCAHAGNYELTG